MNKNTKFSRVLTKGGILTPAYLTDILKVAEYSDNDSISFGSRQDILFKHEEKSELKVIQLKPDNFQYYDRDFPYQNIVSSFVCARILPSTSWVTPDTYRKVLEQIKFVHTIKINLVDPKQNLVPLFYGNLNFIASETPDFWFIYVKIEENSEAVRLPGLISTEHIAPLAELLENTWKEKTINSVDELIRKLPELFPVQNIGSEDKLDLPKGFFPYYVGLHVSNDSNSFWAGFFVENNKYPIAFLREVCQLCEQTGIENIFITPWKTFLIKDILPEHKLLWKDLIQRHEINMQYSSFELNWHVPILDKTAYKLKQFIVAELFKYDMQTLGISFGVQTKPMELFTTIVIQVNPKISLQGELQMFQTYSIHYAFDFNPNNNQYLLFEQNLNKKEIPQKLYELIKRHSSEISFPSSDVWEKLNRLNNKQLFVVRQCEICGTIYDEKFVFAPENLQADTDFEMLPENYSCEFCSSPKSSFREIGVKKFD